MNTDSLRFVGAEQRPQVSSLASELLSEPVPAPGERPPRQDPVMAGWLPEFKHVHGSETVQGETFPNLYTLRGTACRDVEAWRDGVDTLLRYARDADSYSGSHMRPWVGNEFIVERITPITAPQSIAYARSMTAHSAGSAATPPNSQRRCT
jgi:alkyl sulfatase BDS1-like metallo-beta-lactamase superfamily hydrolase